MSIATTLTKIQQRLQGISSPQPLAYVYATPREAVDVGSFPVALVELDEAAQHRWSMAAHGLARHDYQIAIWIIVGSRGGGLQLPELHSRALVWPEPIAAALWSGITLGDTVEWIGDGGTGGLFTYTIGAIEWERSLYGLKISLPVTEKPPLPMAA